MYQFTDTFNPSRNYEIDIVRSSDITKLNEIKAFMESKEYRKAAENYARKKYDRENKSSDTIVYESSFGPVTLKLLGQDYYGSGEISFLSTDYVEEVDLPPIV